MLILKNNLLLTILKQGQADRFVTLSRDIGAGGGTIMLAKGTAGNNILRALGLGETSKEVIMTVLSDDIAEKIIDAAVEEKRFEGVCALLGDTDMNTEWKIINIIVNTGYSDDIMETARKAGATGGTITHARGTANDSDSRFLGITVVPEKEMIMILTPAEKAEAIVDAVSSMDCLKEKGMGIIFIQDVKHFVNLGKNK